MLEESARQAAVWRSDGYAALRMSVNLSVQQFSQGSLVDAVRRVLHDNNLPPDALTLEITERR